MDMGVRVVVVVMIVIMPVVMPVVMIVTVIVIGADAAHMMMMTGLGRALLAFVADNLFAVFAQLAVHGRLTVQDLEGPFDETIHHQRMVVQIGRFQNFQIGMGLGRFLRLGIDPLDQNTGEQKIGEDDDATEPQPRHPCQGLIHQRIGDAGKGDLGPAETHAFPQHARHLGNVGIGVRVIGAAPNHQQQGIFAADAVAPLGLGFLDALAGGGQQLGIDGQFPAITDIQIGIGGGKGIDFPRQVVLDVTRGEQHAGHRQNAADTLRFQRFKAVADDGPSEFQKAAFNPELGQPRFQCFRQRLEFRHRLSIAATMAAQHKSDCIAHILGPCLRGKAVRVITVSRPKVTDYRGSAVDPQRQCRMVWPMLSLPLILAAGLAGDALLGEMTPLFRRIPHPVVAVGHVIDWADRHLNRPERGSTALKARGILVALALPVSTAALGYVLHGLAHELPYGWLIEAFCIAVLVAQNSLYSHVRQVSTALKVGGVDAGRTSVARIVGRDVAQLDRHGVARASVESLAENFADGVVAPVFWYVVAGLPGLLAAKTINTLDSMIGHRSPSYLHFGWASARLDDVINLIPARLSALLLVLACIFAPTGSPSRAARITWADCGNHPSPNSGWPEAAMAGGLDFSLGGPRAYTGGVREGQWIGKGRAMLEPADIDRALLVFTVACLLNAALALEVLGWLG